MARPETPLLTVDVVIELADRPRRPIVLIERGRPPAGWALPGGFVDLGESLWEAARREAREETALDVDLRALLGCYSDPARDPRGHTVSAVFVGSARGRPEARDDAAALALFDPRALPTPLAFDHAVILADFLRFRRCGRPAPLRARG
ncbi:MAG: NUDIX hydrolase [Gammaproteobacteria bacterium]|nr:NUDIX hydrolase [Gammaproteobacteria bacterium]